LNEESFSYEWKHADQRIDLLQRRVSEVVEKAALGGEDPAETFYRICDLAFAMKGEHAPKSPVEPLRLRPPRLTEAWFC
jgi:hypothetical protein